MNKKILIATLVLFLVISIGSVSANEDIADNPVLQDTTDNDDVVSDTTTSDTTTKSFENNKKPVSTESQTIDIDINMDNDAIQSKLNALTDDSVVNFAEGEYTGIKLMVTNQTPNTRLKNIIFNGNGAILRGTLTTNQNTNYYDGIFEIQNVDGFTLTGFNFIAEGVTQATMKTPSCVIIYNTTNGEIRNNTFSGGRFGLYVGSKFDGPNKNTLIINNTVTGVTDMGIISFGSPNSKIINNTIINPANHGIDVRHGSGPDCLVQGNTIIGAKEGIYLMHSGGHTAVDNILNNCEIGITCYGSSNIFCDNNAFTNKTKIGYLLSSGYSNITIGENNDYSGLVFIPMPPTFQYYVVKADSTYNNNKSGVFSQHIIVDSEITANDLTTLTKTSNIISVTLKDDEGEVIMNKEITVSINGETSTVITDANGVAKINVNQANAGVYYYALYFAGDDDYKSSFKTVKVTVNKQVTKATLPAKKFKAKAKTKKLTFTLKDANGNAIAGKKITFVVNKKTYTTTTNAKGIATVKINLTKKGKYTFTAKFAGDNTYKAITKKARLTLTK